MFPSSPDSPVQFILQHKSGIWVLLHIPPQVLQVAGQAKALGDKGESWSGEGLLVCQASQARDKVDMLSENGLLLEHVFLQDKRASQPDVTWGFLEQLSSFLDGVDCPRPRGGRNCLLAPSPPPTHLNSGQLWCLETSVALPPNKKRMVR